VVLQMFMKHMGRLEMKMKLRWRKKNTFSLRKGSRRGQKKNLASAKQNNSESEAIGAGQGSL